MKKYLAIALLVGGLTFLFSGSTAQADHLRHRAGYGYGYNYGYGVGPQYCPQQFGNIYTSPYRGGYYSNYGFYQTPRYYSSGFSITIGRGYNYGYHNIYRPGYRGW